MPVVTRASDNPTMSRPVDSEPVITVEWDPSVDLFWYRCTCTDVHGRHPFAAVMAAAERHDIDVHGGQARIRYGLMPGSDDDEEPSR